MILFRKFKLPRLIYRTKPWKIALMIILPCLLITSVSLSIYFIVDVVDRNTIHKNFNISNISNANKYKNLMCPELTEEDLSNIIVDQFNTNQAFHIDTSKEIKILIDSSSSSSEKGIISFYANFTLTNTTTINDKFTITGFKKQPRPLKLDDNLTILNSPLTNVYPYQLINDNGDFNINSPFYNQFKTYVFNLLLNKPSDLSIDDFFINIQKSSNTNSSVNSWNGDILINYGLNKTKYKYPDFSYSTKINGFKKYELVNLEPDSNGFIDINAPKSYLNIEPKNVNLLTIKQIIVDELIKNDTSIPLRKDDINIEINKVDANNGLIQLKFLQITTFFPVKTYSNVRILGFKELRPSLTNNIIDSHFFQSLTTNEIDTLKLQEIIFNNLTLPQGLKLSSHDIIIKEIIESDNINGIIKLNAAINGYINNPISQTITINNFKIYRPLPMESQYTISREYANLIPSEIENNVLQKIIFSYIPNAPADLIFSDIRIISKEANDQEKTIKIIGNIPKYSEREPYDFSVKFIGFN